MKVLDDPNIGAVFYLEDPEDFFIDDTPPPSSGSALPNLITVDVSVKSTGISSTTSAVK